MTSYDAASGGSVVNQVQRAFNGLGQLVTEYQEHGGAVNTSTSPKVQYAWSEMASGANHSRLTSVTYPSGYVLTYNYASGLNSDISRLTSLSDANGTLESYDHLGFGTVVRRGHSQPNVDLSFIKRSGESNTDAGDQYTGLDRFGRVVDQRWLDATSGTAKDRLQYGYDAMGNRLYRDNLVNAAFGELYAYDGLNQLSGFDRGTLNGTKTGLTGAASATQTLDFDAVGNWESVTTNGSTQTRTHNAQNEITGVSGATAPTFDANGNMTGDETGRQFVYDAWNRMVEVKNSGGTSLKTFEFDGLNRRISETASGTTRDLYYSAQWQVLEERVSSNTERRYVWSPVYVDALVLRDRDTDANGSLDERLYVVQDANFNVVALLDTSGNVVERYTYSPFGVQTVYDASWSVRGGGSAYSFTHGFQGLRYDATTGLNYTHTRPYSPTLARFTGLDWILFDGGDVNLYRAFANKPIVALDPRGTDVITIQTGDYQKHEVTELTVQLTSAPGFGWDKSRIAIVKKAVAKAYAAVRDARMATELYYKSRCLKNHTETSEERGLNNATSGKIATFFNAKDAVAGCSCIKKVLDTLSRIERLLFSSGLPKSPLFTINRPDNAPDLWGSAPKSMKGDTINVHGVFWKANASLRDQVGTIIHEISHTVAATDDYDGYYVSGSGAAALYTSDGKPLGPKNKQTVLSGEQKCTNASSIEYYAMEWYK